MKNGFDLIAEDIINIVVGGATVSEVASYLEDGVNYVQKEEGVDFPRKIKCQETYDYGKMQQVIDKDGSFKKKKGLLYHWKYGYKSPKEAYLLLMKGNKN